MRVFNQFYIYLEDSAGLAQFLHDSVCELRGDAGGR